MTDERVYTEDFPQDYKDRLLWVIKKVIDDGAVLSDSDAVIYFHWARHQNDPAYSFVPERYRSIKWEETTKKMLH